ncbi:MAG: pirin family protein [Pseudomonadota bacterium]
MTQAQVYTAARVIEGAGFVVQRPIPGPDLSALGPFILLDHIGPIDIPAGQAVGAPTHPHAGIETLSYFIEGSGLHYDSLGNRAITGPGEVQWMRAGRGIIHDEGPDDEMIRHGGRSHMVQLWLNMPGETKLDEPDYRSFTRDMIPHVSLGSNGSARLIIGSLGEVVGPLETYGNPFLAHGIFSALGSCKLDLPPLNQFGVFVLSGEATVNGTRIGADQLAVLSPSSQLQIRAHAETQFLLIGGDRIADELVRRGPFVANSDAHMQRIITDYQRGSFGQLHKDV